MLYGQQPQLLLISQNNDDDTDESSDAMDSIKPQGLRQPIFAGLTLEHNNRWYYDQRTYEEVHPTNMRISQTQASSAAR